MKGSFFQRVFKTIFLFPVFIAGIFVSADSYGQTRITYGEFGNTGSRFTVPPGVTSIVVELWGAGGAPDWNVLQSATINSSIVTYAGGGGAYVRTKPINVTPGDIINVFYGQPGSCPQSSDQRAGNPSGTASMISGSFGTISAEPGNYRFGGAASTSPLIDVSYKGGDGGERRMLAGKWVLGGGGSSASPTGPGVNGQNGVQANGTKGGLGGVAATGGGNGGKGYEESNNWGDSDGKIPGGGAGGRIWDIGPGIFGGSGQIVISYNCTPIPGSIKNDHSVPYPPQLVPDSILNENAIIPTAQNGIVYRWQQSTNNGTTWVPAKTPTSSLGYRFDRDSIQVTTMYRRGTNACNSTTSFTNPVTIRVVNRPDGVISGKVTSRSGPAVPGIIVYAQKTAALPGSPVTWIDSAITGPDGQYFIDDIYYGNRDDTGFAAATFIVTPRLGNRSFSPDTLQRTLRENRPTVDKVDFIDTTSFSISGRIFQECADCLDEFNVTKPVQGAMDSVEIYRDGNFVTRSGFINPPGAYGLYSFTVSDPQEYKVEPRFKNFTFSPAFININVDGNKTNVDFKETSQYTISGTFSAGCSDYMGTALLEFSDILPKDANGNNRPSQFRKRVTTTAPRGFYEITLPARTYRVTVINFTPAPGSGVDKQTVLDFFNVNLPKDSLIRDISSGNATLNLTYNRPPTMEIYGLENSCPGGVGIMEQNVEKTLTVRVFQGPVSKNCPAVDSTLRILTNIPKDDALDSLFVKTKDGAATFKLKAGLPNIIAPHYKSLNVYYRSPSGELATLLKNVIVTGVKSNVQTFTTVTPEVPIMILHDPPGDKSFSFWETTKTNETAMRFYAAAGTEVNKWAQVKIGTAFSAGVDMYSTDYASWGAVKSSMTVGARISGATEAIVSTTTTQRFETSGNDAVVGSEGDVFIGAAMNLIYGVGNEVVFNNATCTAEVKKRLTIANNGFATNYIYSEGHIRNTLIPNLRMLRDNPTNTPFQVSNFNNQIKVWEQTLANNELNKSRAIFDKNISFDASTGLQMSSITSSSTGSVSIDFNLNVNLDVATEVGLEIAGSGVQGGGLVSFKMETGVSATNTELNSTTFGYEIYDDDPGDYYSVNIKRDPVYNSPVFELVAGTSSCPAEPGTQPRDEMQLTVVNPILSGIPADGEAEFVLKIGNTSQSGERRDYLLSFDQASNPFAAVVTIGGSPAIVPVKYGIDYLGELQLIVKVKRGASSVFSYEGLQFVVTDACNGSITKTVRVSAFFAAACNQVTLLAPGDGWIVAKPDNNLLPLSFKGYNAAHLNSIELQYSRVGSNNWTPGLTLQPNQLNNSPNGMLIDWNTSLLAEGSYNLRLKVNCPSGTVYSTRVSGIIDRTGPRSFGKPEPTDDDYKPGDNISVRFNELIDGNSVNTQNIKLIRMSDNQPVDIAVSAFENQWIIVPPASMLSSVNQRFKVLYSNIRDRWGNATEALDSFMFMVSPRVPDNSNKRIDLSIRNSQLPERPGAIAPGMAGDMVSGMGDGHVLSAGDTTISIYFDLPVNATNQVRVNFAVGGTAVYGQDYTVRFDSVATDQNGKMSQANNFNGTTGSIVIENNTKRAILRIDPLNNSLKTQNKTLFVTLLEGGDYKIGSNVMVTGQIVDDDPSSIYLFTGTGNFNSAANWSNNAMPPAELLNGDEVIINPSGGECILNVPLKVVPGSKITVAPGKVLRVKGNVQNL